MAIEFRCPGCNRLLRVGDNAGGRQAKCPECGTILIVPLPAATPAAAPMPAPESRAAPDRLSPGGTPPPRPGVPAGQPAAGPGEIRPTQIDLGDVYSRTGPF